MANLQERRDKSGKLISYSIRVHRGRGADGKQHKPWTATFEKECREGVTSDSRLRFEEYCNYVIGLKEQRGIKHSTIVRYRELTERLYPLPLGSAFGSGKSSGRKQQLQSGTHPNVENGSIPGSVAFFGLDPMARDVEKNVTIVYNGISYYPSTIKFAPNNASWRIQLKGDAETGDESLSQYGKTDFAYHILVFHRVTSDHYILETMAESELDALKANSEFWATNGINKSSKAFGKIRIG